MNAVIAAAAAGGGGGIAGGVGLGGLGMGGVKRAVREERGRVARVRAKRMADMLQRAGSIVKQVSGERGLGMAGVKRAVREERGRVARVRAKRMADMLQRAGSIMKQLLKHRFGWVFAEPVDAESLGLPDYHDIISHPMDLGTIRSRLVQSLAATRADGAVEGKVGEEGKEAAAGEAEPTGGAATAASDAASAAAAAAAAGAVAAAAISAALQPPHYSHVTEVARDVRLVFANAMKYNGPGSEVYLMAQALSDRFEEKWQAVMVPRIQEEEKRRRTEEEQLQAFESRVKAEAEEAAMDGRARQIAAETSHVDQQLLELRDSIAPLCRPMTPEEVRRLGRGMRRLKPNAMARLLEIIEEQEEREEREREEREREREERERDEREKDEREREERAGAREEETRGREGAEKDGEEKGGEGRGTQDKGGEETGGEDKKGEEKGGEREIIPEQPQGVSKLGEKGDVECKGELEEGMCADVADGKVTDHDRAAVHGRGSNHGCGTVHGGMVDEGLIEPGNTVAFTALRFTLKTVNTACTQDHQQAS
ncbi:unnamed protein product [Closterium sp. Naga37s-1]|nr:unnamed protein product [Closterium sp. Naga37s-1]